VAARSAACLLFLLGACTSGGGSSSSDGGDDVSGDGEDGGIDGGASPSDGGPDGDGGEDGGAQGASVLVDGPLGSVVPGWDWGVPEPLVILAHRISPPAWVLSPAEILDDGTVAGLENVDRVRVFGFVGVGAPTSLYDGDFSGAEVSDWDPAAPGPVIAMVRREGGTTWLTSLVLIADDGSVSGNVGVDRTRLWRFDAAPGPVVDAPLADAAIPGWNPKGPGPIVILAHQDGVAVWWTGAGSVADDGALGDIVADDVLVWEP